MRKLAIATAIGAAMALSACGSDDNSGSLEAETGDANYADNGDEADGDFPAGFSLYPGAEIYSNVEVNQLGSTGVIMILTSEASSDELFEFYRDEAIAAGFEVDLEASDSGDGSRKFTGENADGESLNFNAGLPDDGITYVQLMIGKDAD